MFGIISIKLISIFKQYLNKYLIEGSVCQMAMPLFHCRNVVQVTEERPDGYEDDDEHYYDDGIFKFFYLLNFQTMWTYFQLNIRN